MVVPSIKVCYMPSSVQQPWLFIAPFPLHCTGDKPLKPISGRVKETAEFVLATVLERIVSSSWYTSQVLVPLETAGVNTVRSGEELAQVQKAKIALMPSPGTVARTCNRSYLRGWTNWMA